MRMVILAAGTGSRLRLLTDSRPKCLVEVGGKSILRWQIEVARSLGISDISVVTGYMAEMIKEDGIKKYKNEAFDRTNMVASLWCAREEFNDQIIISYADILYEDVVLESLINADHDIAVAVDSGWRDYWEMRFEDPLSDAESLFIDSSGRISNIGQQVDDISKIDAQYMGLIKFSTTGVQALRTVYTELLGNRAGSKDITGNSRDFNRMYMTDLLQMMIDIGHPVYPVFTNRKWIEIDSMQDYDLAKRVVAGSNGRLKIRDGEGEDDSKQ